MVVELMRSNCMFRLHSGAIKKEEIEFFKALKAHWVQPLLVIGLRAQRSRLVRDYLHNLSRHIHIAFLPS
jgi:hypothetical protein